MKKKVDVNAIDIDHLFDEFWEIATVETEDKFIDKMIEFLLDNFECIVDTMTKDQMIEWYNFLGESIEDESD